MTSQKDGNFKQEYLILLQILKMYLVFVQPFSKCLNQVLAFRSLEDEKTHFSHFSCFNRARQKLKKQA